MLSNLTTFFNRTELEAVLEDDGYKLAWDTGIDSAIQISNSSHPLLKEFAIIQLDSILKQMAKFWPEVYIELPEALGDIWTWDTRVRNGFFVDQRITDERMLWNKTYQYVTKEISITMHLTRGDLHDFENATLDALDQAKTFFDRKYLMALFLPTYRVVSWTSKDGFMTTVTDRSHDLLKSFATIVLRETMEQLDGYGNIKDQCEEIFGKFWDLSNDGNIFLFRQYPNQTMKICVNSAFKPSPIMKVQYDLEGGQLNQSRWACSKLVLGAVLLVLLMLGSAFASIWFQRYYWEEEQRHVTEKAVQDISTSTVLVETSSSGDHGEVDGQEVAFFEVNLDEHGLSVNVNQDNGTLLSITEASSDLLKEFAGLVLVEAFAAVRGLQEANNAKHVEIPELPSVEASTEETWSWSTHEGHDGFRIRFDNGEWKFEAVSREESHEEPDSKDEQSPESAESGLDASEAVKEGQQQTTEASTEEVWSWSSQGFSGFRIHFTDGKWSFEAVSRESEEVSGGDNSE
ncbi:hypothetical protein quinque_006222 [Culex quinquefasciatus]